MIFKNATVLNADFRFVRTDLTVENGVIAAVGQTDAPGRDLGGDYVVPGLVDIHTHGAMGSDHLDGTPQATAAIRSFMGRGRFSARPIAARSTRSISATPIRRSCCSCRRRPAGASVY